MAKQIAPEYRKKFIIVQSAVTFISVINGTGFNVTIPAIADDFSLLPSEVSWVVSAYIVVFALAAVTYGKLADAYPVKDLITIGLVLFCAGSVISLFSYHYGLLIAGRMIQASGAAAIPALEMLAATRYFPKEQKGRVLGIVASVVSFGSGIGPVIGGFIAGALNWRFIFLAALLTVFTIPFLRRWLPNEKRQPGKIDVPGALLLGGAAGSLLVFISQSIGWLLPVSVVLFAGMFIRFRKTREPFIKPSLFRNRRYRDGLVAGFFSVLTVFGMLFAIPVMLGDLHGLNSMQIGLVMFPGAMSAAVLSIAGGRWLDTFGSVRFVYASMGCLSAGYLLLSTFVGIAPWVVAVCLVIPYLGFTFVQSSLPGAVLSVLSEEEGGIGVGLYNLVFFMAGAFGAAIAGKVLDFRTPHLTINPLFVSGGGTIYSNMFFVSIFVNLAALAIFATAYRKGTQSCRHLSKRDISS